MLAICHTHYSLQTGIGSPRQWLEAAAKRGYAALAIADVNGLYGAVEFAQAAASSLDVVVIADFKGEMAPLYNRLSRSIQRWCVDACTQNNWEIPFPQLTIHRESGTTR